MLKAPPPKNGKRKRKIVILITAVFVLQNLISFIINTWIDSFFSSLCVWWGWKEGGYVLGLGSFLASLGIITMQLLYSAWFIFIYFFKCMWSVGLTITLLLQVSLLRILIQKTLTKKSGASFSPKYWFVNPKPLPLYIFALHFAGECLIYRHLYYCARWPHFIFCFYIFLYFCTSCVGFDGLWIYIFFDL